MLAAGLRQFPHHHDRCSSRREQIRKSPCSITFTLFWSRRRRTNPRDGVGMAHFWAFRTQRAGPLPWAPAEESAVVAYHKERVTLEAARAWGLWCDIIQGKRVGRRPHQGRASGRARQEGRARRGMIRPGRDPPASSPEPRLPNFSKSPFPARGRESCSLVLRNWGRGRSFSVSCISVPSVRLPNAVLGVESRRPAASAANVSDLTRPRASSMRSFWVVSSEP